MRVVSSSATIGAVLTESTAGALEALFRPTTRFRDSHALPYGFTELELLPGLTVESVLATGVTWDEFHRFLRDKIVWMATNVFVFPRGSYVGGALRVLQLGGNGYTNMFVYVTRGTPAAAATATCDFLMRLLATCEKRDVSIRGCSEGVSTPLSGAGLSLFFQESRGSLRKVTLYYMALSADQCRALVTMPQLDVELEMHYCSLVDDAAGAFVECLHSDRGSVELHHCDIDFRVLASALTGNSRVAGFTPYWETTDADTAVLFAALANNSGLVELDCQHYPISDDNWSILCESLKAHPILTSLDLRLTMPVSSGIRNVLRDEQKSHRTRVLADMMKVNTILLTILLSDNEHDDQIYTEEISPYLETNLYRPRVLAVKKTHVREFREKVLGRALDCVKSNPNLVWMFLSQNVDAFVRSEEEEEGNSEVPVAVAAVTAPVVVEVAGSKRKR
jgi:hypothetical protein